MNNLELLRYKIDKLDKEITTLVEKRMEIAVKIGEYKKENGIEILNSNREKEVIKKNLKYVKNKKLYKAIEEFFIAMMNISKKLQK